MNISFMLATVVVQHQTLMLMIKPHHRQASQSEAKGTPHISIPRFPTSIAPHLPRLTGKRPHHQVGANCRAEQPREERVQLRGVE